MMKKQYSDMDKWLLAQAAGQIIPVVVIGLGVIIASLCGVKFNKNAAGADKTASEKVRIMTDSVKNVRQIIPGYERIRQR